MVTCGTDLNGKKDDARLDYEIIAHSASGATYSVTHGSIGTFIPKDPNPDARPEKYSYRHGVENSVWPYFNEVISQHYYRDSDGEPMAVFATGVDVGYMSDYAWKYIDSVTDRFVVGLKGDPTKVVKPHQDLKHYRISKSRPDKLFLVESNKVKDILANRMALNWNSDYHEQQPNGFMNFPQPSDGQYMFNTFFSHFEAEHKIINDKGAFVWVKKPGDVQNHLFDCRLYGMTVREILMDQFFKADGIKNGSWTDYVKMLLPDGY